MLICRRVGNADYKIVGKSLQPRPFARCHASDSIAVYFAFDFCYRSKICQTVVDDEVSLPSHTADYNGVCHLIVSNDFISKSVSFGGMALFVSD